MALNDIDSAVESFKKALDLEPNDGNSFFYRSVAIEVSLYFMLYIQISSC